MCIHLFKPLISISEEMRINVFPIGIKLGKVKKSHTYVALYLIHYIVMTLSASILLLAKVSSGGGGGRGESFPPPPPKKRKEREVGGEGEICNLREAILFVGGVKEKQRKNAICCRCHAYLQPLTKFSK